MKTSEQIKIEFETALKQLLKSFNNADMQADDHYSGYPECGEDIKITVTIPAVYDENHNCISEFTEIDLGKYISP